MEAKDASDDDGDGFWPTRPKAAKDDGRPSDLRLSPAEGDPASLDDILLSEGKDDDDEPSSPSRPSEVKDAKEIGNRQRTLSRTLSGAYRATRARVTRTSSDDGDKARKKVEALVGVLANAQATSTKLLKAASQLRVLAMDKEAKTAVVDAGAVPHLVRLADPATCGRASPPVTEAAARCLWNLAISDRNKLRIAQHGGVAALVALARDGATVGAKEAAAGALRNLAVDKANQVAVVAAGAIPPLVDLVRVGGDAAKKEAAAALGELAFDDDVRKRIAAAGGVAPLVALARGGSDGSKQWAGWALRNFAEVP